ncbi:MAG: hypothetical protein ABGX03_07380 [Methylophilaceae bacterium]|jgi:hypothetical protein
MKDLTGEHILSIAFSIWILTLVILVMHFGHTKFPCGDVPCGNKHE